MKVSNKTILDSVESINTINELSLPIKTAYKLTKISKKLESVVALYNSTLAKLQQKHATTDEDGKVKMVDTDTPNVRRFVFADPEAFQAEYQELLAIEAELDFDPLTLEDLGNIEVSPTTLFSIDWLISD